MISKKDFIQATQEYNTFENPIPAYYFRRAFSSSSPLAVKITVAACGFYELYFNGAKITKGLLSPYISNTDDYIYYDEYEVTLKSGENIIGVMLGNGFQNNPSGYAWEFDKSPFRSAPMFAMTVSQGEDVLFRSDEKFKISPSPIRSDDYRFGEYYDANYEIDGWNLPSFDDSSWESAILSSPPKGELRLADVYPITKEFELSPIQIIKRDDGYIYDFGISHAGICRLCVEGSKGQKIEIRYADSLKDGELNLAQIWFPEKNWERDKEIVHKDTYVCNGDGAEFYQPSFTYHGFRYAKVTGITEKQATEDLLTFLVYHTELHTLGDFTCSDSVTAKLQEMTRRSILSNFHHFPTDCPQREKNGWTADAALSCEAALLNFDPERNYREWMRNIRKAQREDGALPGIVPTGGWGFDWGNGPAWDCVLVYLPYYVYIYRGEVSMIKESVDAFLAYLRYLRTRCDENGLLSIGLGDWCHVGEIPPKSPLLVTDTVMSMDIASKASDMFDAVEMPEYAKYAREEATKYRNAIRAKLIDWENMRVMGNCQTSQAICLYYGVFDESEEKAAFGELLKMIHEADDHIDLGVLGGRVIFHVLSRFGYNELAFKMITREDYPSYGNWIKRGATTLWENFLPDGVFSMNHHFWGDISAWFIKRIAGIQLNPSKRNVNGVKIAPSFISALDSASAYHIAPSGKIAVSWRREKNILLTVEIPKSVCATAELEAPFCFADGESRKQIVSGVYEISNEVCKKS